ncbi:GntR family transcriptional regulator [Pseudonocardia eucalypti]|uniref:GntR family transcriptional regulator n=1 Tax=Pseudonocardia eucalypti TaxID=648755 RepID=A0ABP9Q3J0_9PSEU|nr:DNA-binding GntR family transcriptional regulator [Pseudonocardia eucalypti]
MPLDTLSDRPGRLTDAVHRELRAAVLSGDPAPGQQLSVPELARRLGVSRGSVREAVLGLVADGLAEERPRRGVVVATIGPAELRQIHQIREALEGQAARLGAASATPEALAELAELLAHQRRAIAAGDGPGYAHADERFHARLAEAGGNPMLAALVERLRRQMALALHRLAHDSEEHRERGCAELAEVLAAVRAGDPDAAEAAMRAHIRRTMTRPEGN